MAEFHKIANTDEVAPGEVKQYLQRFAEELILRKAARFCILVGNQTPGA